MTTLPARWRNTNDALRKPSFRPQVAGAPGTRGARPGRVASCAAFGGLPGPGADRAAAHAGAPGRAATGHRRRGRRRVGTCGERHSGERPRHGAAGAARRLGGRARAHRRAQCGPSGPVTASRYGPLPGIAGGTAPAASAAAAPVHGQLARFDDTGRGRWRRSRAASARAAAVFSGGGGTPSAGLGVPDHDPVARRILHQVRGVARRDHAEFAGRLGQRGRGLRLEHLTLKRFLLLQQRLIGLARMAQLVGALGGVGRQPQRDAEPDAERPDDQHDERHPGDKRAGSARSRPA